MQNPPEPTPSRRASAARIQDSFSPEDIAAAYVGVL
jgi:hypothetical protein